MTKALSWRFHKYLGRFHMLTVKACTETALFREWCERDFHSPQFRKYISDEFHPFFQNV